MRNISYYLIMNKKLWKEIYFTCTKQVLHFNIQCIKTNKRQQILIHRGSFISAYILLNLLKELGKSDKMRGLPSILSLFFATSLINSIRQEHEC